MTKNEILNSDCYVRRSASENPNTPAEVLTELAKDSDCDVRRSAAEMKIVKRINKVLECVNKIDEKYNQSGLIKQFTIDLIEHFIEELNSFILGESDLPGETILGSLSYNASTVLEILKYSITMPVFSLFGNGLSKQGVIEGYAR